MSVCIREPVTKSLLIFFSSCCSVNMCYVCAVYVSSSFSSSSSLTVNMDLYIVRSLSVAAPSFSYCVLLSFVLPSIIIRCFLLAQLRMVPLFCIVERYTEFHTLWIYAEKFYIATYIILDVGTFFPQKHRVYNTLYTQNMCAYIPICVVVLLPTITGSSCF